VPVRAVPADGLGLALTLIPDAALVVDGSGTIVSVNDQAERLFGYASGALVGASVDTLVPEPVRHRHRGHRRAFTAAPQTRPMGAGMELTGRRADGSEVRLDISLAPVMSEGDLLVVAAIRDLSSFRQAAATAELAAQQAALRRVATLVARGLPAQEVFAVVTEEARRLLDVDLVSMDRYDPDGTVTVLAARPATLGTRWSIGGRNVSTLVFQTGRPARIDDYGEASGPGAVPTRDWGVRSAVGVPITIEGRLWGVMFVASRRARSLPADTEARLADFTELAATAIANAEAHAALTASRARIVTAADAARQRIERDLHDGTQQRLVSLVLQLRTVRAEVPAGAEEVAARLDQIAAELSEVVDEVREYARGIHPAILARGGLGPALTVLAKRSPVPVDIDVRIDGRLPEPAEVCAYLVVSEALTNAAKHAHAAAIVVEAVTDGDLLRVLVQDDGAGGARFDTGSGLLGLRDRVDTLGGRLTLHSPRGEGTSVIVQLPLTSRGEDPSTAP